MTRNSKKIITLGSIILLIILAAGIISFWSKKENEITLSEPNYQALNSLHSSLPDPGPEHWRYSNSEKIESFQDYMISNTVCPDSIRRKIYIQPLGTFDSLDMDLLKKLTSYTSLFFQRETILLEVKEDSILPEHAHRIHLDHKQLHTRYILYEFLEQRLPDDAVTMIAITNKDLYPKKSWNYVFGEASLNRRVAVSSLYYAKYGGTDKSDPSLYLNRVLKMATHELTHTLSMKHCQQYSCLMNRSISLMEADQKPTWLCPECLQKLLWCTGSSPALRYDDLVCFFNKMNFQEQANFYSTSKKTLFKPSK